MIQFEGIYLQKISHYLPEKIVSNQDLIDQNSLRIKASWIENRLGIRERRWAALDQTTSDLAVEAIRQLDANEAPLFLSSISPDYLTPSTSSETKRKLGWKGQEPALDISAACAGFIFGLELGALKAQSGKNTCVIAAAEVRSRFLDLTDRRTVFLFADAAVACSVSQHKSGAIAKLNWTSCHTLAIAEPEILIEAGGAKFPLDIEKFNNQRHKIQMVDGVAITGLIQEKLVQSVGDCLKQRSEKIEDYDFFVFHQGNNQLIRDVLAQMNVSSNKTHTNFEVYGNSSSASVGVALSEASATGKIKPGNKVLLVAMGAGYHLGLAGLEWQSKST